MIITTGQYEVIESGSIVLPEDDFLCFEVEGLRYRFTFSDEPEGDVGGKRRVTGAVVKEGEEEFFALNVINYNSLFTTPTKPFEVGNLDGGKKLYVYFSIVPISGEGQGKARVIHYTWYKSKEVINGTDTK